MQAIGMKWTMIATAIPTLIGWILLTIAGPLDIESASIFYIGRILTGIFHIRLGFNLLIIMILITLDFN